MQELILIMFRRSQKNPSDNGHTVRDISELPERLQSEIRGSRSGPGSDRPMTRPFLDGPRTAAGVSPASTIPK